MFNPFSDIVGAYDASNVWYLWQSHRALFSGKFNEIYFTTLQGYPQGIPLRFDIHLFNSISSLSAYIVGGPAFAYNFLILMTFVLTFWGLYLFLKKLTGSSMASIIASCGFTFSSYRLMRVVIGLPDLLSTEWILFFLFFAYAYFQRPEKRLYLVGMIVSFILQAYSDYRNFFLLGMIAALLFLYQGIVSMKKRMVKEYLTFLLLFFIGALIGLIPFLFIHRSMFFLAYRPDVTEYAYIDTYRSSQIQDYVLPTSAFGTSLGGISLCIVATYLFFYKKKKHEKEQLVFWGVIGILFFLLSLGRSIKLNGNILLQSPLLPYNMFIDTPLLRLFHDPRRFAVVVHLVLAVFLAFALRSILDHIKKQKYLLLVGVSCAMLVLMQYILFIGPIPTTSLRHTGISKQIADGKQGSVLTFPFGYLGAFYMNKTVLFQFQNALFLQILFRKPLMGAYVSYVDDRTADWFKQQAILMRLTRCQYFYICTPLTQNEKQELLKTYHMRYIWIMDRVMYGHTVSFVERSFPDAKRLEEGNEILYEL